MKLHHTATALFLFLPLLLSCNNKDELSGDVVSGYSPLLLSAEAPSPFSRSYIPQGMYDNFKVFAVSETGGTQTVVMNGYDVKFQNDEWSYVTDTQRLMYWNSNADRYLFTAGAPSDAVTAISATSVTLHLENNLSGSVMACEPLAIANGSPNFGKTVNLRFAYAHCMVCVAFLNTSSADVNVSDIMLTPNASISSEANMTYAYDWSMTTVTTTQQLTTTATSKASLLYDDVTVPANTTDAILSSTRYYCVPDASNTKDWTVTLNRNGEQKTATFENSKTWESGKNYIYIFSLTEKSPKLVKVLTKDSFFDCNDIIPGGEFSDTDMTE